MKKHLRHLWLLLAGVLLTFSSQQAHASHAIGSDISYVNVGPGLYFVTYRFYRDCSGIVGPTTMRLDYEATGCGANGTSPNAGGFRTLAQSDLATGDPYCTTQNAASVCDSTGSVPSNGFPNYNIYTYRGLINLGAGIASQCAEWSLSVSVSVRPNTRNIDDGENLYSEALINTRIVQDDSSPAFPSVAGFRPLIFTCDTTYNQVTNAVIDPDNSGMGNSDRDSLAYRSVQPLSAGNTVIDYKNGFSLASPVRVWTGRVPLGQGPGGVTPATNFPFRIDPVTGAITFTSGLAIAGSTDDEDNKFSVSIAVESWRKINGVRQKISTVRRDILIVIFRCLTRPAPPLTQDNGIGAVTNIGLDTITTINATDTITVDACTNAIIDISVNDINGDNIIPLIEGRQLPGEASISVQNQTVINGTSGPLTIATIRLLWAPSSSTVGGYFPVTVVLLDDGCPIPGRTEQPLILHVVRNQYADAGLDGIGTSDTLILGDSTTIRATTRRPATIGPNQTPAEYRYIWEPDANNTYLDTAGGVALVKPIETTRYRVRVISPQGCEDTASVLVRVVKLDIYNIITPNGDGLNENFTISGIFGAQVSIFNRWGRKIEEFDNYQNTWNGGDLPAGTYYYYVRDRKNKTYKGWLEIVK